MIGKLLNFVFLKLINRMSNILSVLSWFILLFLCSTRLMFLISKQVWFFLFLTFSHHYYSQYNTGVAIWTFLIHDGAFWSQVLAYTMGLKTNVFINAIEYLREQIKSLPMLEELQIYRIIPGWNLRHKPRELSMRSLQLWGERKAFFFWMYT